MSDISLFRNDINSFTQFIMSLQQKGSKPYQCTPKSYEMYVCRVPANYAIVNAECVPGDLYASVMGICHSPIISLNAFKGKENILNTLKRGNGVTTTSQNECFVCCSMSGAIKQIPASLVVGNCRAASIDINKKAEGEWFLMPFAPTRLPNGALWGIYVPRDMHVVIGDGGNWHLELNNPGIKLSHGKGDILLMQQRSNGQNQLFYPMDKATNIEFALTYNLAAGGWAQSGNVLTVDKAKAWLPTQEQLARYTSSFTSSKFGSANLPAKLANYDLRVGNNITYTVQLTALHKANPNLKLDKTFNITDFKAALKKAFSACNSGAINHVTQKPENVLVAIGSEYANCLSYMSTRENSDEVAMALAQRTVEAGLHNFFINLLTEEAAFNAIKTGIMWQQNDIISFSLKPLRMFKDNSYSVYIFATAIESPVFEVLSKGNHSAMFGICLLLTHGNARILIWPAMSPEGMDGSKVMSLSHDVAVANTFLEFTSNMGQTMFNFYGKGSGALFHVDKDAKRILYNHIADSICTFYSCMLNQEAYDKIYSGSDYKALYEDVESPIGIVVPLALTALEEQVTYNIHTRRMRVCYDEKGMKLQFICSYDNRKFNKSYPIDGPDGVYKACAASFMDLCKALQVHPGLTFYGSGFTWARHILPQTTKMLNKYLWKLRLPRVRLVYKSKQVAGTNIMVDFLVKSWTNADLGKQTVKLKLNYTAFDVGTGATDKNVQAAVNRGDMGSNPFSAAVSVIGSGQSEQFEMANNIDAVLNSIAKQLAPVLVTALQDTTKYNQYVEKKHGFLYF